METIVYLNTTGMRQTHQGLWKEVNAGIVLIHTKVSQTLIPWHNIVRIEQTAIGEGYTHGHRAAKQLTNILLRSN